MPRMGATLSRTTSHSVSGDAVGPCRRDAATGTQRMANAVRISDMSSDELIEQAAALLRQAEVQREPCAPIRELLGPDAGEREAYAVQERNTAAALRAGRRLVGRKIGLTSLAVQKQLGVSQPDCGMLFADMWVAEGQPLL